MGATILGFFGGLIGALFIRINNRVNIIRKKVLKEKFLKVVEALCLIVATASVMYLTTYLKYSLADDPNNNEDVC